MDSPDSLTGRKRRRARLVRRIMVASAGASAVLLVGIIIAQFFRWPLDPKAGPGFTSDNDPYVV